MRCDTMRYDAMRYDAIRYDAFVCLIGVRDFVSGGMAQNLLEEKGSNGIKFRVRVFG